MIVTLFTSLVLFYRNYQEGTEECKRCGNIWRSAKEAGIAPNIEVFRNWEAFFIFADRVNPV
jgi:uncharacterized protein (DUF2237 family)